MALSSRPAKVIANAFNAGFVPDRPTCLAAAGGVKRADDHIQKLQCRRLVGEMILGLDGAAVAGVDRLNRVGAADDPGHLHVVFEEVGATDR